MQIRKGGFLMKFLKHSVTAMAILTLAGGALAAD